MKVTEKERAIIERLIHLQNNGQTSAGVGELAVWLYNDPLGPKLASTENWRKALNWTLHNLGEKVSRHGCRLIRCSGLGRGASGVYEFKGNFAKFIEERTYV